MFNFTTQTVLNGGKMKDFITVPQSGNMNKPSLRVGNLRFDSGTILSVEKALPSDPVYAKVTFDLSGLSGNTEVFPTGGSNLAYCRIALYIGLTQSSADSTYANDMTFKGKPFYIEFPIKKEETDNSHTNAAAAALKLVKIAKQVLKYEGSTILNVEAGTGADNTKVTFTATDGHQIIREAALQVYDDSLYTIDCCTTDGGYKNVIVGVHPKDYPMYSLSSNVLVANTNAPGGTLGENEVWIYPGAEAFGDYEWMMHNLRLPTAANTAYFGLNGPQFGDELPVVGGKYTQYTIRMQTAVDNVGVGVVGQRAMSVTTHVLYVLNGATLGDKNANLIGNNTNNYTASTLITTVLDGLFAELYNVYGSAVGTPKTSAKAALTSAQSNGQYANSEKSRFDENIAKKNTPAHEVES